MRVLVLWCPDWAVTAAGYGCDDPVAIVEQRVVASSQAARNAGVRLGLRRREAERHCPELCVLRRNDVEEARHFEPVLSALTELGPTIEVIRPGLCAFSPRGPARYFGGEQALCDRVAAIAERAIQTNGAPKVGVGIAEGCFAATLAAHRHVIVPNGKTRDFLAPLPIGVLGHPELVDLLVRLGLTSLGAFAALPSSSVAARFGFDGTRAHCRARGEDAAVLHAAPLRPDFTSQEIFEVPAERVDTVLFSVRKTTALFVGELEKQSLGCSRVHIEVETEHGEILSRCWRAEYLFDADALIQRLRWQLDGWLSGTTRTPAPTGGISVVRFIPVEVVPAVGRQLKLFGEMGVDDRRVIQGIDRLIGLLGPEAVFNAVIRGGRSPTERTALVSWGEQVPVVDHMAPWPGHHPLPAPAIVYTTPLPIEVTSVEGVPVRVSARGAVTAPPATIEFDRGVCRAVVAWGGPWLSDERFWDRTSRRRRARFQFLLDDNVAHLCFVEHSQWFVEATYD